MLNLMTLAQAQITELHSTVQALDTRTTDLESELEEVLHRLNGKHSLFTLLERVNLSLLLCVALELKAMNIHTPAKYPATAAASSSSSGHAVASTKSKAVPSKAKAGPFCQAPKNKKTTARCPNHAHADYGHMYCGVHRSYFE